MTLTVSSGHKVPDTHSLSKVKTVFLLSGIHFAGTHFSPKVGHTKRLLAGDRRRNRQRLPTVKENT